MEEGTIVKWHVEVGSRVKKGDTLFEIETDKATMEVSADEDGRLARIIGPEGATIAVKAPVAYMAEKDSDLESYLATESSAAAESSAPGESPAEPVATATPFPGASTDTAALGGAAAKPGAGGRVKASPAARRIAAQQGVQLVAGMPGSGPGGRILSTDVPKLAASGAFTSRPPAGAPASASASRPAAGAVPGLILPAIIVPGVQRKRMSQMRKAIARNLSYSKSTIPHWYIAATLRAEALLAFYQNQKAKYPVSINDLIVAACAKVLMEFPAFRSRVDGDDLLEFPGANIGVAVGMDDGLVVPVVLNAQSLTLQDLAAETKRLATAARSGKIENMGQGIFTISNLGMFAVEEFVAIVNPPEASILAVSAAREDVVAEHGAIRVAKTMKVTLSMDHRVIDGTLGAQFMKRLKEVLERPEQLVL